MIKKIFTILTIILVIVIGVSFNLASAKNDKNGDIPEEDGIYDVPGHPDLKVRVFVHKTKPSPSSSPTPVWQCGLSDLDSPAVVDPAGWKLPTNWTYNLNSSSVPGSVGSVNLQTIAQNAFSQWTNAIPKKVTVNNDDITTINRKALDGKNIITWGSAPGSALAVTYIWYNPSTKEAVDVDTIMNKKFIWTWSGNSTCAYTNSYDAQSILTHELGHWFGLDDEYTSEYINNTMYGYGFKGDAKGDTLTRGDIDGVEAIYIIRGNIGGVEAIY